MPTWLTNAKSVLLKRHVRGSKYEPLVETVDLLEVNPNYAHVRFNNGREMKVSLHHLSPLGDRQSSLEAESDPEMENQQLQNAPLESNLSDPQPSRIENSILEDSVPTTPLSDDRQKRSAEEDKVLGLRRSTRVRRSPPYLAENYQL